MNLKGTLKIDGKELKVDAKSIALNITVSDDGESARGDIPMGTQVKSTFSISGDTLTTTNTTISSDGKTTTTETRTSSPTSTTTTTTTTTQK